MGRLPIALVLAALAAAPNALAVTTAADVCPGLPDPCVVSTTIAVDPGTTGAVLDFGTRAVVILGSGELNAGTGHMTIKAGSLRMAPGSFMITNGGDITVETTGAIRIEAASNRAHIETSGPEGGSIALTGGDILIAGELVADATTTNGSGGFIDVDGTAVTVAESGKVFSRGGGNGDGYDIDICGLSSLVLAGSIDASGGFDAGAVTLESDGLVTTTSSFVLHARGGPGSYGSDVDITSYFDDILLDGMVDGEAAGDAINGSGAGATVTVEADGNLTMDARLVLNGNGIEASGGEADLDADSGNLLQHGGIEVNALGTDGFAGSVSLDAPGAVVVAGPIEAMSPGGGGGVSAYSYGNLSVTTTINADGPFSSIELTGCAVTVSSVAQLSSEGFKSYNLLQSSGQMTINGTLRSTLRNEAQYSDAALPPKITGSVIPAANLVFNPNLVPCGGYPTTTTTATTATTSTSATATTGAPTTTSTTFPVPATTSTTAISTTTSSTTAPTTTTTATSVTTTSSVTATTVVVTTTTSTTAPTASTTTVAPSSSTTTTTTRAVTCVPADCNDGDGCTEDTCDPATGCVHDARVGFDAVTCRLVTIADTLTATPVADVGGTSVQVRLKAKVAKVERMVDAARGIEGRRQLKKLRRASRLLAAFIRSVHKGEDRGKIKPEVADRMLELAAGAVSELQPLASP